VERPTLIRLSGVRVDGVLDLLGLVDAILHVVDDLVRDAGPLILLLLLTLLVIRSARGRIVGAGDRRQTKSAATPAVVIAVMLNFIVINCSSSARSGRSSRMTGTARWCRGCSHPP